MNDADNNNNNFKDLEFNTFLPNLISTYVSGFKSSENMFFLLLKNILTL